MLENGLVKYSIYFLPKKQDPNYIINKLFDENLINESDISGVSHYVVINETFDINEIEEKRSIIKNRIKELDK